MKLTPEKIAELKAAASRAIEHGHPIDWSVDSQPKHIIYDLIADLEESQSSEAHWRDNHDNVVRKLRLFTQRDDLPVDRLPAYAYVLELEKQLAGTQNVLLAARNSKEHYQEQWSEVCNENQTLRNQLAEAQALLVSGADLLGKVAMNAVDDFVCASGQKYADLMRQADSSALDAAIAEAVEPYRKQLAEAQARNAQVLSVAEKMRCAGGAQEFQHWFDELKLFLLRKPDTSALDAAIAANGGKI